MTQTIPTSDTTGEALVNARLDTLLARFDCPAVLMSKSFDDGAALLLIVLSHATVSHGVDHCGVGPWVTSTSACGRSHLAKASRTCSAVSVR